MPLLNYTTSIKVEKTVSEIITSLTTHGARAILQEYDEHGALTGLSFQVRVGEQELAFRLPADWRAVLRVMERDRRVARRFKTADQARRVAWRILKEWIAAQMALLEVNLATMEQVFLPYAITPTGHTVYERLRDQHFALPPHDGGAIDDASLERLWERERNSPFDTPLSRLARARAVGSHP